MKFATCVIYGLTLKVPVTITEDNILKYIFFINFSEQVRLDISCELAVKQNSQEKSGLISSENNQLQNI